MFGAIAGLEERLDALAVPGAQRDATRLRTAETSPSSLPVASTSEVVGDLVNVEVVRNHDVVDRSSVPPRLYVTRAGRWVEG
jgi:hypothetical protein